MRPEEQAGGPHELEIAGGAHGDKFDRLKALPLLLRHALWMVSKSSRGCW